MADKIIAKFKLKDEREIIFRYPTFEDAQIMADYANVLSEERTFMNSQGEQISLEFEQERLTKLLKQIEEKKAVQILVFCGKDLVGISDVIMRDKAQNHVGTFGISLAKNFRGVGLGKKLMQLTIDEATAKIPQLNILLLGVFGDNKIGQKLYKKMGFKKIGALPQGLMHKDHFDDHIYMYKKVKAL